MVNIDPDAIRESATRIRNIAEGDFAKMASKIGTMKSDLASPVAFDDPISKEATATLNALRKAAEAAQSNSKIIGDFLEPTPGVLTNFATEMENSDNKNANKSRDINVRPPR